MILIILVMFFYATKMVFYDPVNNVLLFLFQEVVLPRQDGDLRFSPDPSPRSRRNLRR